MKFEEFMEHPDYLKRLMKRILFLITFTVLIVFGVFHLDGVIFLVKRILSMLSSFLTGIIIAFILNIPLCILEEKVFWGFNQKNTPSWKKAKRPVCLVIVILLVIAFVAFVMFMIIPELARSLAILTDNAPEYVRTFQRWLTGLLQDWNVTEETINKVQLALNGFDWGDMISKLTSFTSNFVGSVVNVTLGVTSGVANFIIGLIFAVYMLSNKEMLIKNLKRVIYAFFSQKIACKLLSIGTLSNRIFTGFVSGQCTEALIVGVLCYLGMSLMGLPYALLISTVVAITSVIPVFGAYFGGAFGGLILLLIKPLYCFMFVIYIIILQNVEGNFIYPKVVGNSVGLPGLWVMLSIFVCGDLFGFIGVLLGVPIFSVLYSLLREATENNLKRKHISDREVLANCVGIEPELTRTELVREFSESRKKQKNRKL